MISIKFENNERYKKIIGKLTQWDYGQMLQIFGINLIGNTEIHFAQSGNNQALRCDVDCENDAITVRIPDKFLEDDKSIYAYIYVTDKQSGRTEYTVYMNVKSRARPKDWDPSEDPSQMENTITNDEIDQLFK